MSANKAKKPEKRPCFSIITVTKDNETGLKTTHKSIEKQRFTDFEWIVIDGDSTDDTQQFLKTTNANWISEPDNGIYDAMNKGMKKATGNWLLFLNAGDTLASAETLNYVQKIAHNETGFIYGDSFETTSRGDIYKPARSQNIARGMFTHHQSMFYRHEMIGGLRYNTDYKIAADYDFTARFLAQNLKTQYINIPICIFESGGISQQQTTLGRHEQYQIRHDLNLTNPLQNKIITAGQAILMKLRQIFPNLYWNLKSRHS